LNLKKGFSFFVIPGLTRNPVTLLYIMKKEKISNYLFITEKSLDTGFHRYVFLFEIALIQ